MILPLSISFAGVAFAVLVAAIPPNVHGSVPEHVAIYLESLKEAFLRLLSDISKEDGLQKLNNHKFRTAVGEDVAKKRRVAFYLLKDASKLLQLPFYKVDPRLKPLLEDMFVTEALLLQLLELGASMATSSEAQAVVAPGSATNVALRRISLELGGGGSTIADSVIPDEDTEGQVVAQPDSKTRLLLTLTERISERVRDHQFILATVEQQYE